MNNPGNLRVASIDVLRAVTMVLMIFVNDLWSLHHIPGWLEHTLAEEDGMGLADTIFPAFLFIVGLSIPFAVAARRDNGDHNRKIILHVFYRSLALMVMGVWLVNGEEINEAATGMHRVVWNMICVSCFVLIWNAWPEKINKTIVSILRMIAIITLAIMAWRFRGGEGDNFTLFTTSWWGILGLIGWAYLMSAFVYIVSKNNIYVNIAAWIIFLLLCTANHAQMLPANGWLRTIISPVGEGSMPALVTGGVITSQIFRYFLTQFTWKQMMISLLALAVVLLCAGFALRPIGGISKIKATPSWVLICSSITIIAFMFFYYLTDILGKAKWFDLIKPAGTNTLVCYLLPYYAYGIPQFLGLYLPAVLLTGAIGLIKSMAFSLLMVMIGGWLQKRYVRLKL